MNSNPENRSQLPATKDLHPGIVPIEDGGERPTAKDVPSIQEYNSYNERLDTDTITEITPDSSAALILTKGELEPFQEKLTAQRAYHEQRNSTVVESHIKRNVTIASLATVALAVGGFFGVKAATDNNDSETLPPAPEQTTAAPAISGAPVPIAPPNPEVSASAKPEVGANSAASEFNITEAEYDSLVDNFRIDVATHPTAESVLAAFNEKMNLYYNGGNTAEERAEHLEWLPPATSNVNPGWNSWANELHTAAILDGLFIPDYESTPKTYMSTMQEVKKNVNGLWVNSFKSNETPYVLNYNFTPTSIVQVPGGDFTYFGTVTYTDNAEQIPSARTDSRATFSETYPDQALTAVVDGDHWRIFAIEKR